MPEIIILVESEKAIIKRSTYTCNLVAPDGLFIIYLMHTHGFLGDTWFIHGFVICSGISAGAYEFIYKWGNPKHKGRVFSSTKKRRGREGI